MPEIANGHGLQRDDCASEDSPVSELIETVGAASRSTAARAMATTARRKKAEALLDAVGGDVSKAIRAGKSTELPLRGGERRAGHHRIFSAAAAVVVRHLLVRALPSIPRSRPYP